MQLIEELQKNNEGYEFVYGVDEVGRGPLAGPIVICFYCFDKEKINNPEFVEKYELLKNEVNDSKKLTEKKREKLFSIIREFALEFSLGEASASEIDQYGIIEANRIAIFRGFEKLKNKPSFIYFDYTTCGFDFLKTPYEKIVKGDSKIFSISCASILAKVYRDHYMMTTAEEKFPGYNFKKHKGYGTKEHYEAIGKLGISKIHRRCFLGKLNIAESENAVEN